MRAHFLAPVLLFALSLSCAKKEPEVVDPLTMEIDDPQLIQGRELWVEYCAECHIRGLGGAPKIATLSDWEKRIAQGKDVLYRHAIEGFEGPLLNEMPPKGGYDELTDEQVKLAVDFLVYSVSQLKE